MKRSIRSLATGLAMTAAISGTAAVAAANPASADVKAWCGKELCVAFAYKSKTSNAYQVEDFSAWTKSGNRAHIHIWMAQYSLDDGDTNHAQYDFFNPGYRWMSSGTLVCGEVWYDGKHESHCITM